VAQRPQRLVLYLGHDTGYGGVAYVIRALGPAPEVSWCEHEESCERHHLVGRHLTIDTSIGTPRAGRPDGGVREDVTLRGFSYGSGVVDDIRDMSDTQIGLLRDADAIVAVANRRLTYHLPSLVRRVGWLQRDLASLGRDPKRVPVVFQLERSDLDPNDPDVDMRGTPRSQLDQMFEWPGPHAFVETVAYRREGIHEALDKALAMVDALP